MDQLLRPLGTHFIGNDPSQWHANIPTFGRVEYQDVYPGIDVAYYGNQSPGREGVGLEYDFIVSPGVDPDAIALNFAGADGLEIDRAGNLVVHTAAGDVVQQKPYLYQEVNGARQEVAGSFVLSTEYSTHVTFDVGAFDASRPLVIDPLVMGYSTFLGGGGASDRGYAVGVDSVGNAYVTGDTNSIEFPTTPGSFDSSYNGLSEGFVSKLNATGSALVYSTYLGGNGIDGVSGIAVDAAGNAYVTGNANSADFPVTPGAFDTEKSHFFTDCFITKLTSDGSALTYTTFLEAWCTEIDVDGDGNAYVTGSVRGDAEFPVTPGAYQTMYGGASVDAIVAKLNVPAAL